MLPTISYLCFFTMVDCLDFHLFRASLFRSFRISSTRGTAALSSKNITITYFFSSIITPTLRHHWELSIMVCSTPKPWTCSAPGAHALQSRRRSRLTLGTSSRATRPSATKTSALALTNMMNAKAHVIFIIDKKGHGVPFSSGRR